MDENMTDHPGCLMGHRRRRVSKGVSGRSIVDI